MFVYFLTFGISFLFAYCANRYKKNKIIFVLFSGIAILCPSILAGFRSKGIGTDTNGYINFVFNDCLQLKDFGELIKYIKISEVEFLFVLVDYVITRFTNVVNYSYFVFEFIILLFVYLAAYKFDERTFYFSYLFFLILFFNRSLNMCRQTLALAIVLFNFSNIREKNIIKFTFWTCIAILFHKTAIISIVCYPLYNYIFNFEKPIFRKLVSVLLVVIGVYFFNNIFNLLYSYGIVNAKYLVYLTNTSSTVSNMELMLKITVIIIEILIYKNYIETKQENEFLVYMFIIGSLLSLLGMKISFGQRLSYYFTYYIIFFLSNFYEVFKGKKQKFFILILTLMVVLGYSYMGYGVLNWDQTVPYKVII